MIHRPGREPLERLTPLLEAGTVVPVIDSTYALEDARSAFERYATGEFLGKIVITHACVSPERVGTEPPVHHRRRMTGSGGSWPWERWRPRCRRPRSRTTAGRASRTGSRPRSPPSSGPSRRSSRRRAPTACRAACPRGRCRAACPRARAEGYRCNLTVIGPGGHRRLPRAPLRRPRRARVRVLRHDAAVPDQRPEPHGEPTGVAVLDMTDPAKPVHTTTRGRVWGTEEVGGGREGGGRLV